MGQLVTGSVAVHNVVLPDVKVTVPPALPGSPISARVAVSPKSMVSDVAEPPTVMENEVGAGFTETEPATSVMV